MLAWQVLYEGFGLILNGVPNSFSMFGFVMASDLNDVHHQVIRVAMQDPVFRQHQGDPSSLVFNPQEIYERPDLGTIEREELEIDIDA
ncbi:hypothetical protein [Xanthomonas sp. WHRI 8932A]|uniref:hypothetical protein n=1 Tax=unclassified Xanthomonas TaxID=2643310 RepID=UPI002B23D06A|nr:hypothetical protein [Xanthomonas sp. WHRI 8932A]MEA9565523.1 hypothetical protein [Xanthomonas sp. WHRI 8932A]